MHETEHDEPRPAGALEELAGDPSSRKRFLTAVGGGATASAFALFLAACGKEKGSETSPGGSNKNTAAGVGTDQYGEGDLGIARYALVLDYIGGDFYDAAGKSGKLTGRAADLAKRFGEQERQHVKALEA